MATHMTKTSMDAGHTHGFSVDGDGHGDTCPDGDPVHVHRIVGRKVMEAEGHTHTLPEVQDTDPSRGKADPVRR